MIKITKMKKNNLFKKLIKKVRYFLCSVNGTTMNRKKMKMKKLHIGCGKNNMKGWINADLQGNIADVELDARKPLPFKKNSISYIYNEHFIEHITKKEGVFFFRSAIGF